MHVASWERAFRHFGKRFSLDQLRRQIGKGSDQYLPEFLTPAEIERFGKQLDEYRSKLFKEEYLPSVQPFAQVRPLFECLGRAGKPIVLATSGKKSEASHYTKLLGIDHLIAGQTTADDAEESKPEPDIFEAALAQLDGISPNDCIVLGDTRFDVAGGRATGCSVVGVTCGGTSEATLRAAGAIAVYRDPADLLAHCHELLSLG